MTRRPPPPVRRSGRTPPPPATRPAPRPPRPTTGLAGPPGDDSKNHVHLGKVYEKGMVTTGCGLVGPVPGMEPKPGSIKSSGWPTWITCPTCLELPGVRPAPPVHRPHNHGPDCECHTAFPPVDLDAKTKGYNG